MPPSFKGWLGSFGMFSPGVSQLVAGVYYGQGSFLVRDLYGHVGPHV